VFKAFFGAQSVDVAKAAEDALHRVYLTRRPDDQLQLPTSTFSPDRRDLFQDEADGPYEAAELPAPEIMYASSGRTGIIVGDEQ
jgi:large subunit ribosomal protein L44